jgi:hypothetical protein
MSILYNTFFNKLKGFLYICSKVPEVADLGTKDYYLAQVNADIYANYSFKKMIFVPLMNLLPIHKLERETVKEKTNERIEILSENSYYICKKDCLNGIELNQLLPSISHIKVIKDGHNYLVFDGNGRLRALNEVIMLKKSSFKVEVELYEFQENILEKILSQIYHIRQLNEFE